MAKRSRIIFCLYLLLMLGIGFHLYSVATQNPATVVLAQNSRKTVVASVRGTIYDTNKNPFVNELTEYRVGVCPKEGVLSVLSDLLDKPSFQSLRDNLSRGNPTVISLDTPCSVTDGLSLFSCPVRYSQRVLAPHVIGYTDAGEQNGLVGIEKAYNRLLNSYRGEASVSYAVDGNGRVLSGVEPGITNTVSRSSGGIMLTLDADIQRIAEDVGSQYIQKGAVVILNPYTGDILAMASFPSYQPDTVKEQLQDENGALINRCLSLYDCGSVFKIVTAAAALEKGIDSSKSFDCTGVADIENTHFHCHNRAGHGVLNMQEAFAQSCNVYFIRLAQEMGAGQLYSVAGNFGFGKSYTLCNGMRTGQSVYPSLETLENSASALANFSFGQGYLLASPLHIATCVATVVNNGVCMTPKLIKGEVDEQGNLTPTEKAKSYTVISKKTARILQEMMETVVQEGTGEGAQSSVCALAGKTGTAETGRQGANAPVVQSWFAGYVKDADIPYVITVLGEDATNTQANTTRAFRNIAEQLVKKEQNDR